MGALKSHGRTLREVERVPYKDAFLIADLLTPYINVLPGEPKAGKTMLAAGMCHALLSGADDFCGYPVNRRLDHIAYGVTDEGAEPELRERFRDEDLDRVHVFPVKNTHDPSYWNELAGDMVETGVGLFVLDHVLGSLGSHGDISDAVTAQRIIADLRQISGAAIPVLALTHTPKGAVEGLSSVSSPIGGRAIAAGARSIITLRYSKRQGRRIVVDANRARGGGDEVPLDLEFLPGTEVPVWSRGVRKIGDGESDGGRRRTRKRATLDAADRAVTAILEAQPPLDTSINALASTYGPDAGASPQTLRKKLPHMLSVQDGAWVRTA